MENYLTEEAKENSYGDFECLAADLGDSEYFLMGDNREISHDSRSFGPVPADDVLYKQSEVPTKAFYLKSMFLVVVFILSLYLCRLIEAILTECAYKILFKTDRPLTTN